MRHEPAKPASSIVREDIAPPARPEAQLTGIYRAALICKLNSYKAEYLETRDDHLLSLYISILREYQSVATLNDHE